MKIDLGRTTIQGFPQGGPKIGGPWLWALVAGRTILDSSTDLLSEASGGTVTEVQGLRPMAQQSENPVGDNEWTANILPRYGSEHTS